MDSLGETSSESRAVTEIFQGRSARSVARSKGDVEFTRITLSFAPLSCAPLSCARTSGLQSSRPIIEIARRSAAVPNLVAWPAEATSLNSATTRASLRLCVANRRPLPNREGGMAPWPNCMLMCCRIENLAATLGAFGNGCFTDFVVPRFASPVTTQAALTTAQRGEILWQWPTFERLIPRMRMGC